MRTLIRGTAVIKPEGEVLPAADVVIEGRRYAGVFPVGEASGAFDQQIDGEGKLLSPGFVNAHTHLAMTLFRGKAADIPLMRWLEEEIWPAEKKLTPEDAYWFSCLGLVEMIRSGTVAFADMYFYMEETARAVEEAGLRALLSCGIIAPEKAKIAPELKTAEAFARAWNGAAEGRIRTALSPHAPYTCLPEVWREVTALARELGVPIHTHVAETYDEVSRMHEQTGQSPVEWLEGLGVFAVPTLAAHCVHVSEKDCNILAAHRVAAAHCPTSNAKLACGIAPVTAMLDMGVNVALGTDGAGSAGDLDMVEEMRLAALFGKLKQDDPQALPAHVVHRMATSRGAAALGWKEETGTISAGRWADGILLSRKGAHMNPGYNPLVDLIYSAGRADVDAVFVDGRFLMREGRLLTLDEERIVAKCKALARRYR